MKISDIAWLLCATHIWQIFTPVACHVISMQQDRRNSEDTSESSKNALCDIPDNNARFDCFPNSDATEEKCQARGCCWNVPNGNLTISRSTSFGRSINIPYCYFPANYEGYVVTSLQETEYGMYAILERKTSSGWPSDVMRLQLNVWMESDTRLHFKIFDPSSRRYEVPINTPSVSKKSLQTVYSISVNKNPFGIKVIRKSTNAILFDSSVSPLIFADQFLQISTHTRTDVTYGLGEHMTSLTLNYNWQQVAMWNRDINPQFGANLYGAHPYFLNVEPDGKMHGVFLLNSNAMDVNLQPLPVVTFRTIGGVLDFYIFTGPSGDNVIQQYTDVVGKPYMPPYWSLGYHLCRWGYGGSEGLKKIIARNRALGIPYDVQWNDIDYMAAKRDWTYDTDQFKDLPSVVDDLHQHGQKYVVIVDPAISSTLPGDYPPYDEGLKDGIFIMSEQTKKPLVGQVWPGLTVFPDFTHPKTYDWWYRQADSFHKQIEFDGLWIDMNDPSNEMFGSTVGCSSNNYDMPPYLPGIVGSDQLPSRTICPSAKQFFSSHYNLHNVYGLTEANVTMRVLEKLLGRRSLVISRSTFPSQGLYGGHWTGDIFSTWQDMQYTIPAMLKFNMFGIPLVGSDICGFQGETTEELCVRWTQLGAFYPFMRNHNTLGSKDQDPASFSSRGSQMMKFSLEMRYALLPYLYTLFYHSHVTGKTVARPLSFNFPLDSQTYNIDQQFMWGDGLLISPVLNQGQTSVKAYLPSGTWYDLYEGVPLPGGQWVTLDAPMEKINVHVRGGSILPFQEPNVTTSLARTQPFHLLVALDEKENANGDLFCDDGETLGTIEQGNFNLIKFSSTQGQVSSVIMKSNFDFVMKLGSIRVLGVKVNPKNVTLNDVPAKFSYAEQKQELIVEDLQLDLKTAFVAKWQ